MINFAMPLLRSAGVLAQKAHQRRRKLRVLVHRAAFDVPAVSYRPPEECFFIKMTNLSPKRPLEVTHVWFETDPSIDVVNPGRPLPKSLEGDETYETWIPIADVPDVPDVERLVRVQLSNGKVVKGRHNDKVRPRGNVAGWQVSVPTSSPPVTGY
ncbi:MAG: hypothetical protein ACRD2C_18530 [Acidimicrobiales bacterium]